MKLAAGLVLLAVTAASPEIRYFRYDRLVKAAGQPISGDARAAMKDLVGHGTN